MNKSIRILMLEDEPADTQLIVRELRQGGFNFTFQRVVSRQYFLYELQNHTPDLVLSDHALPSFDGMAALALTREKCPHVPFIFVTAKHGDEAAVDALKKGASDYVLKGRLSRLAPAVRRALREAEESQVKEREHAHRLAEFCPDILSASAVAA
ncbi:MAG: response regulator [Verrucomicrobia bacterium]|nr:response regulator [Verrucomicrobiota bacterium]